VEVIQKRALETPDHVVYRFLENGIDESEHLTYAKKWAGFSKKKAQKVIGY